MNIHSWKPPPELIGTDRFNKSKFRRCRARGGIVKSHPLATTMSCRSALDLNELHLPLSSRRLVPYRKVRRGERGHGEQQDGERRTRAQHRDSHSARSEQPFATRGLKSLAHRDGLCVLRGDQEDRLPEHGLARCDEARVVHAPIQQHGSAAVRDESTLGLRLPVENHIVRHWRQQEDHRGDQHPLRILEVRAHEGQNHHVDQDEQREHRRQRQAVREQDNVQLLVPLELTGGQDRPGVSADELHVALSPLVVALPKRHVVHRVLFLAGHIGREHRQITRFACSQ